MSAAEAALTAGQLGREHLGRTIVVSVRVSGLDASVVGQLTSFTHRSTDVQVRLARPDRPSGPIGQVGEWSLALDERVELDPE